MKHMLWKKAWPKRLGDMAVGALILFALFVLVMGLYERRHNIFAVAVLGIFMLVFLGIFRDWVRSLWKPRDKPVPKDNAPPGLKRTGRKIPPILKLRFLEHFP